MKNWKKYALASASVLALGATLAACGNLTGDNQKSSKSEDGKTVIKMYQIGDKPDNLDELLENANKIIERATAHKIRSIWTEVLVFLESAGVSITSTLLFSCPPQRQAGRTHFLLL